MADKTGDGSTFYTMVCQSGAEKGTSESWHFTVALSLGENLVQDLLAVQAYARARGMKGLEKIASKHLPSNLTQTLDKLVPEAGKSDGLGGGPSPEVKEIQRLIQHAEAQGIPRISTVMLRQALNYRD